MRYIAGIALCTLTLLASIANGADKNGERISIYKSNKYYWQYKGQPVLLLGGSDEDNLFNDPELMIKNLDALQKCGGNYIRATLSWRDENNVAPYLKEGDKYELTELNPEFFKRLEDCCRECYKRDIIVQPEIWATWDFYGPNWPTNPFNPANNLNYTTENTKMQVEWTHMPFEKPQPFFHTVPKLNNDMRILAFQQAVVRKVLDVTLQYPNVLYCLDNETRTPEPWALYWADFMRREAKKRKSKIEVTEMRGKWDLNHEEHAYIYENPKLFTFTEVSQNNWYSGQLHYDRLLWWREKLKEQKKGVRPMNNVKVYGAPKPKKARNDDDNIDRFWQNIFAGCASTRFHRPPSGIGLNDKAQQVIRSARKFTDAFNIFACEPRPDLLTDREDNEAYCLAEKGKAYAVYFPKGGSVSLNPIGIGGSLAVRWFDPVKVQFLPTKDTILEITGGIAQTVKLTSPDTKQIWLVLIQKQ